MYSKGQKITVIVTNIVPFGAFCDLGEGVAGLIHISEFSDYFVKDIHSFVSVGDNIEVVVLDYDSNKKQAKLSYKSCRPELLKKNNSQIQETGMGFKPLQEKISTISNGDIISNGE